LLACLVLCGRITGFWSLTREVACEGI
jgi:hypothetical protein